MGLTTEQLDTLPAGTPAADLFLQLRDVQRGRDFKYPYGLVGASAPANFHTNGFQARYLTDAQAGYTTPSLLAARANGITAETLLRERASLFHLGAIITVDINPNGKPWLDYRLEYDGAPRTGSAFPGLQVYRTADQVEGELLPAKLVAVEEARNVIPWANIDPSLFHWFTANYTTRLLPGEAAERFWRYVGAENATASAPTGDPATDAGTWVEVNETDIPMTARPAWESLVGDPQDALALGPYVAGLIAALSAKLYPATGQQTDGALTVKAATDAFALKLSVSDFENYALPRLYDVLVDPPRTASTGTGRNDSISPTGLNSGILFTVGGALDVYPAITPGGLLTLRLGASAAAPLSLRLFHTTPGTGTPPPTGYLSVTLQPGQLLLAGYADDTATAGTPGGGKWLLVNGQLATSRNIAAVDATKRNAVVAANAAAVPESDASYCEKYFIDEVTDPANIKRYDCKASVQSGGGTLYKWFRSSIA